MTANNLDIPQGTNSECVGLIYLDPPFNSHWDHEAPVQRGGGHRVQVHQDAVQVVLSPFLVLSPFHGTGKKFGRAAKVGNVFVGTDGAARV